MRYQTDPIMERANRLEQRSMQRRKKDANGSRVSLGRTAARDDGEGDSGPLPMRYQDTSAIDRKFQMKQQVAEFYGPRGVIPVGAEEVDFVANKERLVQLMKFDRYFLNRFKFSNPHDLRMAQQMYPELFEMQLQTIREKAELQVELAKIKLLGPKTKEDIHLQYLVESGTIEVPNESVHIMNGLGEENLERGIWNPYKWRTANTDEKINNRFGAGYDFSDGNAGPINQGDINIFRRNIIGRGTEGIVVPDA